MYLKTKNILLLGFFIFLGTQVVFAQTEQYLSKDESISIGLFPKNESDRKSVV
jgi:hypothetical protein